MDNIEKMRAAKALNKTAILRTPQERFQDNPGSRKFAIEAFCWACMGESKKLVKECASKICQLHAARPWK